MILATVEREGEDVRRLVDAKVVALERADLVRSGKREPELALLDPLRREHPPRQLDRRDFVDSGAAPVLDLDGHAHRFRAVPVSSACCL